MYHRKLHVNDGFGVSKVVTLRMQKRNMENLQQYSKMWNYEHCWTKMIRKHNNNSPSNWALVYKLLSKDGKDSEDR